MDAGGGADHQAGDGDRREHGLGGVEEAWVFHLVFLVGFTAMPGPVPGKDGSSWDVAASVLFPFFGAPGQGGLGSGPQLLRFLIRDRRLVRISGPNRGLDAGAGVVALKAGAGAGVGRVIAESAASYQQKQSREQAGQAHGLVMSNRSRLASG